ASTGDECPGCQLPAASKSSPPPLLSWDVFPGAASHVFHLPQQIVHHFVGRPCAEAGRLDDQQRAGSVMEEEVVVGLVQLLKVRPVRDEDVRLGVTALLL